jgi:AAA+ ATPase superfamily predicted ATPase
MNHLQFSSWIGYVEKVHSEQAIRKKFQDQIDLCEKKLFQYKEAQIANIRGVLMRGAMQETEVLMHMVWKFWMDEVNERKMEFNEQS